jgi:hypothetical protein
MRAQATVTQTFAAAANEVEQRDLTVYDRVVGLG